MHDIEALKRIVLESCKNKDDYFWMIMSLPMVTSKCSHAGNVELGWIPEKSL